METIGQRLRRLRENAQKSQKEMSAILGIERTSYVKYENDKNVPPSAKISLLSKYFNVSADYILGTARPAEAANNTQDFIENLFPDNPEIVQCLHNITEDGIISDGDSKYKLDDSARTMLRTMILAYLKEAKEKGTEHAKINLP